MKYFFNVYGPPNGRKVAEGGGGSYRIKVEARDYPSLKRAVRDAILRDHKPEDLPKTVEFAGTGFASTSPFSRMCE